MVISLGLESAEPDLAREIAIELLESRLKRKLLGEDHGMGGRITRIVVEADSSRKPDFCQPQ